MYLNHFKMKTHPFTEPAPVDMILQDPRIAEALARLKYLADQGIYSEEQVVASFIGMAPIDDPKVVVAVVLDSPVEDASGGSGAAPVFAEVTLAALHQLGEPPDAP